jgi:uncharacterized protein DUF1360
MTFRPCGNSRRLGDGPPLTHVLLAVLAVWRVTHLLAYEDGPADVLVKLRARLGAGALGQLMDCFKCLSLWVAAPVALAIARRPLEWALTWLALSGGACLLERVAPEPVTIRPLSIPEGGDDGVLRTEAGGPAGSGADSTATGQPRSDVAGPGD